MFLKSIVPAAALALVAAVAPLAPPPGSGDCPPDSVQGTQVFTDEFGPELGNWSNETLTVPKFAPAPDATLVRVEVEICGQSTGTTTFMNLDNLPCVLTYQVHADAQVTPADPGSPVDPFVLAVLAAGGPFLLGPGESGRDSFDSGLQCGPVQSFTDPADLAHFIASPGDEEMILLHDGVAGSEHQGCGLLDFSSTIFTTLTLRVTYVFCVDQPNLPPICSIEPVADVECQGDSTIVTLDGSGSMDPEGEDLEFLWTTTCPNSFFDDDSVPMPVLVIDTSTGCNLTCTVRLRVSDGRTDVDCQVDLTVFEPGSSGPGLDVKPGSCPNPINTGSNGVLPVGLLGTAIFDVSEVDQDTIRLERADGIGGSVAPRRVQRGDVGTPFSGNGCDCHTLTADGIADLSLKFSRLAVVEALELDAEPNGTYVEVHVTGQLLDGSSFQSDGDCVRVRNH